MSRASNLQRASNARRLQALANRILTGRDRGENMAGKNRNEYGGGEATAEFDTECHPVPGGIPLPCAACAQENKKSADSSMTQPPRNSVGAECDIFAGRVGEGASVPECDSRIRLANSF